MNVHPAEVVIAIQAVQCVGSLVLAYLMLYFFRSQRRQFLRHWALSAVSLAIYLIASAGSLALFVAGNSQPYFRLSLSIISLIAAYLHVVWLMFGVWEAIKNSVVPIRVQLGWLLFAAIFGVITASIAPFNPDEFQLRSLLRVDLRYSLTGLAFLIAAVALWRLQRSQNLIGVKIGAAGFALYGLQMLHVVAVNQWQSQGGTPVFYQPYIGLLELLAQSLISMGIVIWLLETQRMRTDVAQSELAFARTHDPITRLPNRRLLTKQLEQMLKQDKSEAISVISIHVNRFALVHRTFGWRQAEQLMARVSNRIRSNLHSHCVLGRVAERDFMILRPTVDDPDSIRAWCEDLLNKLSRPIAVQEREFFVGLSAGISLYPTDSDNAESLMQKSLRALTQSTMFGRGVVLHHQIGDMEPLADESSLQIEGELRRAIDQNQLVLHFQPIVCATTGQVDRFEALLRWQHPRRGLLGPDEFLDEALEIGLLGALEDQVLEMALHQLKRWHKALSKRGSVGGAQAQSHLPGLSLNLSAQRFQQHNIVNKIEQACQKFAIEPKFIELEITENAAIHDLQRGLETIHRLREMGVQIALDDFGTGYSSLAHLQQLNVNTIKLDRGFLHGVPADPRQRKLVSAVIGLCHEIDMRVVAEGVETIEQFDFLVYTGCDLLQGFLLQTPLPAKECRLEFDLNSQMLHRS